MDMNTLLHLKWITNKVLLYSTMNSAQYHVAAWMGGEFEGEWKYAYAWLSPSPCLPETSTTLLIIYIPIQNKKVLKNSCMACFWKGGEKKKEKGKGEAVREQERWRGGGRGTKRVRDRGREEGRKSGVGK